MLSHKESYENFKEEFKTSIDEAFERLSKKDDEYVKKALKNLIINPRYALKKMGFTEVEADELDGFAAELKNDFISLYHKEYLFELPKNHDSNLLNALFLNNIIYLRVEEVIDKAISSNDMKRLNKIKRLLESEKLTDIYGGLRTMGFSNKEASFILPENGYQSIVAAIYKNFMEKYNKLPKEKNHVTKPNHKATLDVDLMEKVIRMSATTKLFLVNAKKLEEAGINVFSVLKNKENLSRILNVKSENG